MIGTIVRLRVILSYSCFQKFYECTPHLGLIPLSFDFFGSDDDVGMTDGLVVLQRAVAAAAHFGARGHLLHLLVAQLVAVFHVEDIPLYRRFAVCF